MKKDLLDLTFDWIESITAWMFERDLFKNWFNIISWTGLSSVLFVLYLKTGSGILAIVGVISAILVFFYGWHTVFHIVNLTKNSERTGLQIFFTFAVSFGAVIGLFYYLIEAFSILLRTSI